MRDIWRSAAWSAVFIGTLTGCGAASELAVARPILIYSGERIEPDSERMADVEDWLMPELDRIDLDPDFLIRLGDERAATYPWDTIEIVGDTAALRISSLHPDAQSPFLIYAYLRLMQEWGDLAETLPGDPEAPEPTGYDAERAILAQVSDVWLLGRSVFDTQPFGPLDELVYSAEFGFLDEFIFATQGERFDAAAAAYAEANPGRDAEFRAWFEDTFNAPGPQYVAPPGTPRGSSAGDRDDDADDDPDDDPDGSGGDGPA